MRFKLRQMEIFRAVMTCGTVSAAARMLHVSQPAISRSLAYTEQKLGFMLFQRGGGRLVPTPEAERLLCEVERVYRSALEVNELVTKLATTSCGTIRLLSDPCLGDGIMLRSVARFVHENPEVKVRYRTASYANIPLEILNGRCDVAVSALPIDHPGLQSRHIYQGRMVCVMGDDDPLLDGDSVSLEDLSRIPFISYSTDTPFGKAIARTFEHRNLAYRPAISIEHSQDALALARAGGWPALVDEFNGGQADASTLETRPLMETIPVDLWLVTPKHDPASVQSRAFIDILEATLDMSNAEHSVEF